MKSLKINTGLVVLAVGLIAFSSSCRKIIVDAGPLTEEVRDVSDEFNKINISGSLDLLVNKDDTDDLVRVEAGEKILEHIEIYVQNGTLFIEEESNNFLTSTIRRVYVNKNLIDEIEMLGSGEVNAEEIVSSEFELKMEGSGDSDIEFGTTSNVDVTMDGSGDCKLEGDGISLTIGLNGSGDVNARFLEVEDALVNVNGSGDVEVYASENLLVNINGSGDVNYWGDPANTDFNINGSGDIDGHN